MDLPSLEKISRMPHGQKMRVRDGIIATLTKGRDPESRKQLERNQRIIGNIIMKYDGDTDATIKGLIECLENQST